jgi:hypothetical protein
MKSIVLCGLTLLSVVPALVQTSVQPTADSANKTVTLTGCVGSSADSSGFMLANAMVVPTTAQPGQTATSSPLPPASTSAATQPATATPPPPVSSAGTPPPASPAQVPPPASPAQVGTTTAAGAAAGTPAAVGTSGTTPTSVTGTTGVTSGGATTSATSGVGGYRLSGTDMTPWAGQRVQVVGTFSPATATAAGTTPTGGSGAPAAPPLQFRVQSVQPTSGPCPK